MQAPKIICIDARYIFPTIDGIGRYIFNLIDHLLPLIEQYDDLSLLVLELDKFKKNSVLRNFDGREKIRCVGLSVLPQTFQNQFLHNWLKSYAFDLFHYPQFDLPWMINKPTITTIHDMNPQIYPQFFGSGAGYIKKYYSISANLIALKRSSRLIAISNNTKRELLQLYGSKYESKINVIYSGCDENYDNHNDHQQESDFIADLKNKYGFDKYLLYVGNNRPHKNLENTVRAFHRLKMEFGISHKLVLVGHHFEGKYTDVKSIAHELKEEDQIIILSANDSELLALYKGADVFVYCSLSEGLGFPVLEAMSHGTPVVTSNLSSLKEIAEGAAVLVNPYSSDEIAVGIYSVLQSQPERDKLVARGFERARQFTWENCARNTLRLYRKELLIVSDS